MFNIYDVLGGNNYYYYYFLKWYIYISLPKKKRMVDIDEVPPTKRQSLVPSVGRPKWDKIHGHENQAIIVTSRVRFHIRPRPNLYLWSVLRKRGLSKVIYSQIGVRPRVIVKKLRNI